MVMQTLSAALQSVNPLLHAFFLWLLVFLIQSHYATSSFDTSRFSQGVNSFTYLIRDLI